MSGRLFTHPGTGAASRKTSCSGRLSVLQDSSGLRRAQCKLRGSAPLFLRRHGVCVGDTIQVQRQSGEEQSQKEGFQ